MSRLFPFLVVAVIGVQWVSAQDALESINLSDPDLVYVSDSVIPIPLEIFASLD